MTNPFNAHPLTSKLLIGGLAATAVVWLAGHYGIAISAEDAAAIVTAIATFIAFVGREGISKAWHELIHGPSKK